MSGATFSPPMAAEATGGISPRPAGYENRLVAILAVAGGVAALDAQAIFYLSAFIVPALHLTGGQMGLIGSAVLVGWALSGVAMARLSDRIGRRVPFLVGAFLSFALLSGVSGLASSFAAMFLARFAMGMAEGPVIPIKQALVMAESTPSRRGLNMGIVQNFGAQLIGTLLAPLMLVAVAERVGWRWCFLIAGVPGALIALAIGKWVAEPPRGIVQASDRPALTEALTRNTLLCVSIGTCSVGWYFLILTFAPLFLTGALGFTPLVMAKVMGAMGAAGAIAAIAVPGLSDRIGRKPAVILFSLIGIVAPLGLIMLPREPLVIGGAMLVGCLMSGTFPLFMATIPQESVPVGVRATATAMVVASAQVAGGLLGPSVGGQLADTYGLKAPMILAAAMAGFAAITAMFLHETSKREHSA